MDKRVFITLIGLIILIGAIWWIRIMLQKEDCELPEIILKPENPEAGKRVDFSFSSAMDDKIEWDFGDKKPKSSGSSAVHVYDGSGSYIVVAMRDEDCSVKKEIFVNAVREMKKITPVFSFPRLIHVNDAPIFSDATKEATTWSWKVEETRQTGNAKSFSPSFRKPGTYHLTFSVKGDYINGDTNFIVVVIPKEKRVEKPYIPPVIVESNPRPKPKPKPKPSPPSDPNNPCIPEKYLPLSEFKIKFLEVANDLNRNDDQVLKNAASEKWKNTIAMQGCDCGMDVKVIYENTGSGHKSDVLPLENFKAKILFDQYKSVKEVLDIQVNGKCISKISVLVETEE